MQFARWFQARPRMAQQYRLNIGTIVVDTMLKVRLVKSRPKVATAFRGDRVLGEVEEGFINQLSAGDTFFVRRTGLAL